MRTLTVRTCAIFASIALGGVTGIQAQTPADRQSGQSHAAMMKGMTEAEFVPMMIKHHQDGIEMARLEEQNGASAEVKALAAKIRQGQEGDIPELRKHSEHAAATAKGTSGMKGHDQMMEQQSQATMKKLKSASGQALDHAFVDEMAKHHQMAIDMAETAKLQTPEVKQLAQKMVTNQRQELSELKKLQSAHAPSK